MPSINFNFVLQLIKNPRFAKNAAVNLVQMRTGREERTADPTMLQIEVTSRCNFKCSYCIVHNGTETEKPHDMSLDLFRHILERFPRSYYLQLHGQGEPLLHPQLQDMVALADREGRFSCIVSNGSLWNEAKSKALLSAGVDVVAISLDLATQEQMEADRTGMSYHKIIKTIDRLIQWRDAIRPHTAIGISAVLKKTLLDDPIALRAHVKRLDDLGIDFLFVGPLAGTSTYRRRYPERHLSDLISGIEQRKLITFPTKCAIYETPSANFIGGRCMWPWMALYVNFDGTVAYCSNNHRVRVGHIDDERVRNLVTHRELRRRFVAGQVPDGCKGCQYLLASDVGFGRELASADVVTNRRSTDFDAGRSVSPSTSIRGPD